MKEMREEELIQKIAAGNKEAFAELYRRYRRKMFTYLFRYLGDYHAAEDIFHDAFFDAYKRLREGEYREEGNFSAWLFTIATNFANKHIRKQKRIELTLDTPVAEEGGLTKIALVPDCEQGVDSAAEDAEEKAALTKAIAELPEKYRRPLVLYAVEGLKYKDIARRLSTNVRLVAKRIHRARLRLYKLVAAKGAYLKKRKNNVIK